MPSSGRKPIAKSSCIRNSQDGVNSANNSVSDARSAITGSNEGADTPVTYYMGSPLLVLPVEDGYKNIAHLENTGTKSLIRWLSTGGRVTINEGYRIRRV